MTKGAMPIASAMASSETWPSHSRTICCQVSPSSSCSRTNHTIMRVPLNVGWPPQILGSATIRRPSSTRWCCPFAFAFMPLRQSMRPLKLHCKPSVTRGPGPALIRIPQRGRAMRLSYSQHALANLCGRLVVTKAVPQALPSRGPPSEHSRTAGLAANQDPAIRASIKARGLRMWTP